MDGQRAGPGQLAIALVCLADDLSDGVREGTTLPHLAALQSDARRFMSRHIYLVHCSSRSLVRHVSCALRTRRLSPVSVLVAGANSQVSTQLLPSSP